MFAQRRRPRRHRGTVAICDFSSAQSLTSCKWALPNFRQHGKREAPTPFRKNVGASNVRLIRLTIRGQSAVGVRREIIRTRFDAENMASSIKALWSSEFSQFSTTSQRSIENKSAPFAQSKGPDRRPGPSLVSRIPESRTILLPTLICVYATDCKKSKATRTEAP